MAPYSSSHGQAARQISQLSHRYGSALATDSLISLRLPSHRQGELQGALRSQKPSPSCSEETSPCQEHVSRALLMEQLISKLMFQREQGTGKAH